MNLAPTRSLRRAQPFRLYPWWDKYSPLIVHGSLALGILALLLGGSAHWLAWIVLVHQVLRSLDPFVPDKDAAAALLTADDFLERERARVDKRLSRERSSLILSLSFAAGLGWLSRVHAEHTQALAIGAAIWALLVLLRFGLLMPELRRELAELGGKPKLGWRGNILLTLVGSLYLVLLPLILLYHGIRGLFSRTTEDEK